MKYVLTICTTDGLTHSRVVELELYEDIRRVGKLMVRLVGESTRIFPDLMHAKLAAFSVVPEGATEKKRKRRTYPPLEPKRVEPEQPAEAASS